METGLTFLEFNYMLMQGYDFFVLSQKYGCKLQLGGNDQWSNMLAGADLIRRKEGKDAFAMTFTLLLNSEGKKMGKTAGNAVWLDPNKTSPYDFFQYWRNVDDADVEKCLSLLTFVPMDEVRRLGSLEGAEINKAKAVLAYEVTKLVHGDARQFAFNARPRFLSKAGLTPAERGTALHKFMQYADFSKVALDPVAEVERLYEYEYISRAEADAIDPKSIIAFTKNSIFNRILNCDRLMREQRFLLDVKAGDIYDNLSDVVKDQTVIVQGAVDCMFIEGDHIVLLDFKTDKTDDESFLIKHYSDQLKTYCIAAEKMFSLPVTECYIYSLNMNKTIKII